MRTPNDPTLEAPMLHVGLDIHSKRIAICVLTKRVLAQSLDLLGVEGPEQM